MNATQYKEIRYNSDIFLNIMARLCGRELEQQEDLKRVWRWMTGGRESLLLMGNVGTGKSTIAKALCHCWSDFLTIAKYCQCDVIADRIRQDESYKYDVAFHKGLLVLDDLGTEVKVFGEEAMPFIIYRRYERNLPTVITTNYDSNRILERYGERIADRLRTFDRIVLKYKSLRK